MRLKRWNLIVAAVLAALVAGLAITATAAAARNIAGARGADLTGEISVLYSSDFMMAGQYAGVFWPKVKQQFESRYPGAKLNLVGVPGNAADEANTAAVRFRSESTAPDVLEFNSAFTAQFAASGYLMPLNRFLASDSTAPFWRYFPSNIRNIGQIGKNIYAISIGNNVMGIYYNKAMLRRAGIPLPWNPKSWTDILQVARKVKDANPGVIPLWLLAGETGGPGVMLQGIANILFGSQTPVMLDPKTKRWVVDSPGLRSLFSFYKSVFGGGLGQPASYVFRTDAVAQPHRLMAEKKLAIAIAANNSPLHWADPTLAPWPGAPTEAGLAPIPTRLGQAPGRVSALGGWVVAVAKATKEPDLAWALVNLLLSQPNLLYTDRYAAYVPPDTRIAEMKAWSNTAAPFWAIFRSYSKYGRALPVDSDYPVYLRALGTATGQIVQQPSTSIADAIKLLRDSVVRQLGPDRVTTLK